jgi:uncharacterized protein YaaR (DUF327 family)
MGVNFPDIRYIINWGPARNLLDQLQEAGRAGRDGKTSHAIILYHGWQLSHCNSDVKQFVRSAGCLRVAAYSPFDQSVQPTIPKHDCCSYCKKSCLCNNGNDCEISFKFDTCTRAPQTSSASQLVRPVTDQERKVLNDALHELVANMSEGKSSMFDQVASHGFSKEFIEDIVKECHSIFSVSDITSRFPVFCTTHAYNIIEIINEIFNDIPEEHLENRSDSLEEVYDLEHFSFLDSGSEVDNADYAHA